MTPINVCYHKSSSKILCRPVKSLCFYIEISLHSFVPETQPENHLLNHNYFMSHSIWPMDCQNEIYFFSLFFRPSYLFLLYIFSESINHFPDFYIDSILLPLQQCLAKISGIIKSSHGNMYVTKQHICYTVELHCLYKNRSPDDASVAHDPVIF